MLILVSQFELGDDIHDDCLVVVKQAADSHRTLDGMDLDRVVFVDHEDLEDWQQVLVDKTWLKLLGNHLDGLGQAPSDHRCIITCELRIFLSRLLPLISAELAVDVCQEMASCNSHRVDLSFLEAAAELEVVVLDCFVAELVRHF